MSACRCVRGPEPFRLSPYPPSLSSFKKPTLKEIAQPTNLRLYRQNHVEHVKEKLFGVAKGLPGEKHFTRPLEGRTLGKYYFPSRFLFQDFCVHLYYKMQALRFKCPPSHKCVSKLTKCLELTLAKRNELQKFFASVDYETFRNNPTLQDIYSVYRSLDEYPAIKFAIPQAIWKAVGFSWINNLSLHKGLRVVEDAMMKRPDGETKFAAMLTELSSCRTVRESRDVVQQVLRGEMQYLNAASLADSNTSHALHYPNVAMDFPADRNESGATIPISSDTVNPRCWVSLYRNPSPPPPFNAGAAVSSQQTYLPQSATTISPALSDDQIDGVVPQSDTSSRIGTYGEDAVQQVSDSASRRRALETLMEGACVSRGGAQLRRAARDRAANADEWKLEASLRRLEKAESKRTSAVDDTQVENALCDLFAGVGRDSPSPLSIDGTKDEVTQSSARHDAANWGAASDLAKSSLEGFLSPFQSGDRRGATDAESRGSADSLNDDDRSLTALGTASRSIESLQKLYSLLAKSEVETGNRESGVFKAKEGVATRYRFSPKTIAEAKVALVKLQRITSSDASYRISGTYAQPRVLTAQVGLRLLQERVSENKKTSEAIHAQLNKEDSHPGTEHIEQLKELLQENPELASYYNRRYRFFEPLFRRRRLAYIQRLSAGRVKNEKKKKYQQFFVDHPDQKELWPDNKGSCSVKWPSPYH